VTVEGCKYKPLILPWLWTSSTFRLLTTRPGSGVSRRLQLSLTASFGVAAFPKHASSPQQLIACADTAMYEAKAANKNCVRFAADLARKEPAQAVMEILEEVVLTTDN
jgi:predicted signal transduction protein with EAL and GGDEF domain